MILKILFSQLFTRPFTNRFPAKYMPKSVLGFLGRVQAGKVKLVPPVPVPPNFRGKITYDREKCIGCRLCSRVGPAQVIQFQPEVKKNRYYIARCTFCAQCVDACPVGA
ncbi:MAG: 4Fe-4S dicluster domain-containing protein, partial [Candidatus Bipolaricaulota bacterium]